MSFTTDSSNIREQFRRKTGRSLFFVPATLVFAVVLIVGFLFKVPFVSAQNAPVANLDSVSSGVIPACAYASGWAFDPDRINDTMIEVHLYNPTGYNAGATNLYRGDVNTAFGITGNRGFGYQLPNTVAGTYYLNSYAIGVNQYANVDGQNTQFSTNSAYTCTPQLPSNLTLTCSDIGLISGWTANLGGTHFPLRYSENGSQIWTSWEAATAGVDGVTGTSHLLTPALGYEYDKSYNIWMHAYGGGVYNWNQVTGPTVTCRNVTTGSYPGVWTVTGGGVKSNAQTYTLTAPTITGWAFSGWVDLGSCGASGSTNPITYTPSCSGTVLAYYNPILTISASGQGTCSAGTTAVTYNSLNYPLPSVSPNAGYSFTGWTGTDAADCADNDIDQMNGPKSCTCNFADVTAPTSNSISINAGAANTNNAATTLTLSSTDSGSGLSQMQFSCDNSNWSAAEAYATSKAFNITNGVTGCTATQGTKTVYVRFKDVAGNWSSAVSDTIVYDATAPTISDISATNAVTGSTVRFYADATDGGSGLNTGNAAFYLGTMPYASWNRVSAGAMTWDGSRFYRDVVLNDSPGTTYRAWSYIYDVAGNQAARDENPTEFTILNRAPTTVSVSPNSGSFPSGARTFTTVYRDLDGASHMNGVLFLLNSGVDGNNTAFYGYYNPTNNACHIFNSDNAGGWTAQDWSPDVNTTGAKALPWVTLNSCSSGISGNDLTVTWNLTFNAWNETLNQYLYSADAGGLNSGWSAALGTITVDTTAPSAAITTITTPRNTPLGTIGGTASDGGSGLSSATLVIRRGPSGACDGSHADWNGSAWTTACTAGLAPTGIASWSYASTPSAGLMTDGTYIVYINVSDAAGNSSGWVNQSVVYDATAPTSNSISINGGAAATSSATAVLTLSSTDATSGLSQMQFSCDNTNWSTAEAYATSKVLNMTNGVTGCTATEGTKTVYVRFKDAAGNWSSAVSDTIIYDVTAPTHDNITVSSNSWVTNSGTYDITLTSTEAGSGFGGSYGMMALINYQGSNSANPRGYFAWHPSTYVHTDNQMACTGGGYASKNSGYGAAYITLTGCSTSVNGNQRTVVFTVTPNVNFGRFSDNDISFYTSDALNQQRGWTNFTLGSGFSSAATQSALSLTSTSGTYPTAVTLTSSGGSGAGTVTYTAANGTATGCSVTGTTLNFTSAGTCSVAVHKAADTNYNAIDSATTTVTIAKANQAALTLTNTTGTYGAGLTVSTSGGSGTGAVTYAVTDAGTAGCSVGAGTGVITFTSAGTCTITATKAADTNYNAISTTATTVTINKATQSALSLTSTSGTYPTAVTLTSSGGSGAGTVTYTAANGTATGCSVTGTTLNFTSAGTCSVAVHKAADTNYNAIDSATTTVTIAKANQATLNFSGQTVSYPTAFSALSTTGGSGAGAVTYAVTSAGAGCSIVGTTLSYTGPGTCGVTATKAADTNYNAISSVERTFTINAGNQAALTITSTSGTYPTSINATTTGGSGTGAVTYTVANGTATGCAMTSTTTLGFTSAGTCLLRAHKAGDTNYSATSSATTTVTIAKGEQTALVVSNTTGTYPTGFNLTTGGGSGSGVVTYTLVSAGTAGCSVTSGGAVTFTSVGTCTVNATKAADSGYNATTSANTTVNIVAAALCTGGTVSEAGGYTYHTFYGNGTLNCTTAVTADVLIVGGGGGGGEAVGGYGAGGGGGAGGVVVANGKALSATSYSVTVGAGGAGSAQGPSSGGNSSFGTGLAKGGGYGGRYGSPYSVSGGSGGGAPGNPYGVISGSAAQQPTAIGGANNYGGTGYGNSGGNGGYGSGFCNNGGGGGGGANGAGGTPPNYYNTGTPGAGLSVWGGYITVGYGGGGGPNGGSTPGTTYSSNYGSGGGGGPDGCNGGQGSAGIQGVVIVRYVTPTAPTVTTATSTAIGVTQATVGGTVTANGGVALTARGTCWGTSPSPTTNCTAEGGTSVAAFTHARTGLTAGTLYYARAYAENAFGRGYSSDITFTTQNVPTLTSPTVSSVGSSTATMGATLSTTGSTTITARGTCWGTSASPTGNCAAAGGTSLGAYTHARTGLTMNTSYYIRGYADYTDGAGQTGRAYSSDIATTTLGVPTVASPTVASVTTSQVTAGGNVTATNGAPITERGTCYGTGASPVTNCTAEGGTSAGVFAHERTGLQPNTLYYFRAYADNTYGRGYSEDISTTTLPSAYLVSAGDQFFDFGQSPAPISTITIVDPGGDISASNDIRIAIATSTVDMRWVISDTSANFGGTAAGKVSNPVSYENGGSVLVIPVDVNFTAGNTLTVSGLSFANFNTVNPPVPALSLRILGAGDPTAISTDTKTVAIRPVLGYSEHTRGQVNDKFNAPTVTNQTLFAFKFVPGGEAITVGPVVVQLADVTGIGPGDISNVILYRDVNSSREYESGVDMPVGGIPAVSFNSNKTGTITFPEQFPAAGPADYILVATVTGLQGDDRMFISLGLGNLTTEGATVGTVSGTGSLRGVLHVLTNKGGNVGGGGGIITTAIGGETVPTTTTVTTGGSEGTGGTSGFIDPDSGTPIGNEPGFLPPSGEGNPYSGWTNGPGGLMSDGSYTMTNSNGAQQSYAFTFPSIPTGNTIDGIAVKIEGYSATPDQTIAVKLSWDGGSSVTSAKVTPVLGGVDGVFYLGSPSDKWGRTWSPNDFNSGNFRVELIANTSGGGSVNVDALQVKVFHRSTGGSKGGGGAVFTWPDSQYANVYSAFRDLLQSFLRFRSGE